ncbi:uncharacterized protein LOC124449158 [Xenia sp. Carnegie-2017]|uniref:uncharacterized protein LOC124449158 n=1 Tax=Xenia sp. Carnegie-2017 TaxID=2897299 RepID=UPI001F04FDF8|nr:uncharacterized protein LOC124449158 [Xenia sp. Carnegie-2017]
MFQERSGARSSQGIKKILVVLVDDYLYFNIDQAQRLKNNGVIIYFVGFGPWAYEYQLNTLASKKDPVFMLIISETHTSTTTKMSWAIFNANSFYLLCGTDAMALVFG